LTSSSAGDVARNIGEQLKRSVSETGAAVRSRVRDTAKKADKS
jgi:hypothetical protein